MKAILVFIAGLFLIFFLLALELVILGIVTYLGMKGIDFISIHTGHGAVFPKDIFNVIWGAVTFVLFILKRFI